MTGVQTCALPILTKIKICGIKTIDDALAAIDAGADYLGFNFYSKSPRYIEKNGCAEITSVLKKEYPHIKLAGVFVNSSVEEVNDILNTCSLDLAQLHGDETAKMVASFNGKAFKAIRLSTDSDMVTDIADLRQGAAPVLLVDAAVKGVYGGSGVTADWDGAAEIGRAHV